MPEQLIVGIDIGSMTMTTSVARGEPSAGFRHVGYATTMSAGIRCDEVLDKAKFERAFAAALDEARSLAGGRFDDIVVSVASSELLGVTNQGHVNVDTGYPIYQADVDRALAAAEGAVRHGYRAIHRVVQGFSINGERVRNPIGRVGQTLQVYVRDFLAPTALIEAIQEAANQASIRVQAIVPSAVASGEAVLRADERERGVVLIDIGGASTDIAMYADGALWEIGGTAVGGHHITRDLAALLDLSLEDAERMKYRHGVSTVEGAAQLDIDWSPRGIAALQNQARQGNLRRDVPRVVAGARLEQILADVKNLLEEHSRGLHFHAGVVITGGASRMPGVTDVISARLGLPVRVGAALAADGFPEIPDAGASAALGLVRY
ncbi:MAG: cell division protein FtsA, partial [Chloroflexota bacterium]